MGSLALYLQLYSIHRVRIGNDSTRVVRVVEDGPIGAIAVVLVFVILNIIAEYVLFPRYAGKGLNIPPWVVLVSVFFWGWLLGALGTLIAVPITLLIRVLLSNFTEARWLVDVLGGEATNIRSDESRDPAIASKP